MKYIKDVNDRLYIDKICDRYNILQQNVYSMKRRLKTNTYKELYLECLKREKLKEELKDILVDKSPSILVSLFNGKYPNASAISFCKYLYSEKDKGIVFDKSYEFHKKVYEYLKSKGYLND